MAVIAFPVGEAASRSRAFLRLALRGPRVALDIRPAALLGGGRASPNPRPSALYVDALATEERFRRRGAARALLAEAERQGAPAGESP